VRDNPEGGELDSANDIHKRCKKNSPVLSCIDKRKKGCDRGSDVGAVYSGRGPVSLRKPKESGRKERIL